MAADDIQATSGVGTGQPGGFNFRALVDASGREWPAGIVAFVSTGGAIPGANLPQVVQPQNPLPVGDAGLLTTNQLLKQILATILNEPPPTPLWQQALAAQGVAVNAELAPGAAGQLVSALSPLLGPAFTLTGKQIIQPYANPENTINAPVTTTDTSVHTLVPAQGAGLRAYLTSIQVVNNSATNSDLTLTDGTNTLYIPAPANGGAIIPLPTPFRSVANTAVTIQATTAATTIKVSAMGYKGT